MKYSRVMVVTDNRQLWQQFLQIVADEKVGGLFSYYFSPSNQSLLKDFAGRRDFQPINVMTDWPRIIQEFDLVISLHCKQMFPSQLVNGVKCINVHPGFNPYNRGWFPQVFSIINKLPLGATIHEIDEHLDHGPIIDQEKIPVFAWDTSLTAYNRVVEAELRLIRKNLRPILCGDYVCRQPDKEGNVNLASDFQKLCHLNMEEIGTFQSFLDRLRALTHGEYHNGYFFDEKNRKIFVKVELQAK
jgi:methionyl-tRNA formyltransferase